MTRKRTTSADVRKAQEARQRAADAARPIAQVSVDMRLTTSDLARLAPEQIKAVFEGVGNLAAQGVA